MRTLTHRIAWLAIGCLSLLAVPASAQDKALAPREKNKTLAKMAEFVGGTWVNDNPDFKIEIRYEWVFNKTAIRSHGILGKGSPQEAHIEATMGWDPVQKTVYYIDFHGSETVYKGTVSMTGDQFQFDFATLIGPPGKWRSVGGLTSPNDYEFTIYADKDGKWVQAHKIKLKRVKA